MTAVFIKLLNMSITASWLVLAVILLRLLLKKAPKWIMGVLWGFVALRLVCPFSFESLFSLIPSTETINITQNSYHPSVDTGFNIIDNNINDYLGGHYYEGVTVPANLTDNITTILGVIWIVGIFAMLLYAIISFVRIRRKVQEAVVTEENIWECDHISTPFILGIIHPRIYLPSAMAESDKKYVISHEQAHLKRKDHIWKPFGFLLLSIYWFNPVLWLAYILLCKDIELACDEKVLKQYGSEIKKQYSDALINCSVPRRTISACPLAFGEVGVKERVKNVLSYKKPTFWIIITAVGICIVTALCLLTNPKTKTASTDFGTIKVLDVGTDRDDVNIEVIDFKADNGTLKLTVRWNNNSTNTLNYGEPFVIYKKDTSWTEIETNTSWNMLAYPVQPSMYSVAMNLEKEYPLTNYYNFTGSGTYRFSTSYFFENDHNTDYSVWVDFKLEEPIMSYKAQADKLVSMLQNGLSATGVDYQQAVDTTSNILCGDPKYIEITGANEGITIYRYNDLESARSEAKRIAADGNSISGTNGNKTVESSIDFTSLPHWYIYGNAIVCYVGQNSEIISIITDLCGGQFAGAPTETAEISELRKRYPTYFGLSTGKGLEVYEWQMAENSYSFGLLSGTNRSKTSEELMSLKGVSAEEMRAILSTYNIPQENICVIPIIQPYSSYLYKIDDDYWTKAKEILWGKTTDSENKPYAFSDADYMSTADAFISGNIKDRLKSKEQNSDIIRAETHITLDKVSTTLPNGKKGQRITEYMIVFYKEYKTFNQGEPYKRLVPAVLTYDVTDDSQYTFTDFWIPSEDSDYEKSIREKFPQKIADTALNCSEYADELESSNDEKANQIKQMENAGRKADLSTSNASPARFQQ